MGQQRNWTEAEKNYLSESWGTVSVPSICKHLNRSENAIYCMKDRLGLGAFYKAGEYVTLHQLILALGYGGSDGYKRTSWIKNRNLPVFYKTLNQKKVKAIYIDDFWKWAEENQTFLNFSKFEENALGAEPEWVKRKRYHDIIHVTENKKEPWTSAEDDYLKGLLRQYKYTYPEIAEKLNRTEGAVQRRILDLNLKERPLKADNHSVWTERQIGILSELIKSGASYESIHKSIPDKSTKAIRGYVYRFYLTESMDKVRKYIGSGSFGDNLPEKQLKHLHIMQPEQKAEVKETVSLLAYVLIQVAKSKSGVSEEFRDYFQKDMCQNWSDIYGCTAGEDCCDSCDCFVRIQPQYCVRCGSTIYSRQEIKLCDSCRIARKKQAQRKWAVLNKRRKE